ncbi:MAG: hypothetical protein ACI85I_000137 [Arenicella sp.]|jgi:hypothetical protein
MEDLHIIQKPNQEDSPFIFASEKRRLLKIHKWYSFDETTWDSLVDWIQEYQSRNEALLTYEGYIDLPIDWEYEHFIRFCYPISPENTNFLISHLFVKTLKEFNVYSKNANYSSGPNFIGNMGNDLIKFSGRCCVSDTVAIFTPIYSWIEIYLKTKPEKIRIEIWMEYFNTAAMKKVFEFIKALDNYGKNCDSEVQIFWYAHEEDEDSEEIGEEFKEEISSLEIIILDSAQWKRMSK